MAGIQAKVSPASLFTVAAVAAGALVAGRYFSTRKVSAAERLADALLDSEPLRNVVKNPPERSEARLAACAEYMLNVCHRASEGWGIATGSNDPVGFTRSQTHAYTQAVASVLTEAELPEHTLTYAVAIPGIGEVRGTRKMGPLRLNGVLPAYAIPDTAQINLFLKKAANRFEASDANPSHPEEDYSAQLESELNLTEGFVTGRPRLFGAITLRDNEGNVGRLNVGTDGTVNGTITRDAKIVGRFEGRMSEGVRFKPYQIESGEKQE